MPVYLYRNLTTGATFEVEQRISDPALATDPTTGDPVKRLIQPVGIAFKGSGFYVTDSRKGATRSTRPEAGGEGAKDAPAASASTESAAKADPPPPAASSPKPAASASD